MLAYVFWHWRRPDVSVADYEQAQRRFHAALAGDPSPGFLRSCSLAIAGATWAAAGGEAYEDWYLVEGSGALDPLNAAAISASRQAPHDAAAALAAGGTAGLYSLRSGSPGPLPRTATWFTKPGGMAYGELFAMLKPVTGEGEAALWGRQMTLGPAPEFCLHTRGPVALPSPLTGLALDCRAVWAVA
jgi:hypothetical protein